MHKKKTWVDNPTKKQTVAMFCFWLSGIVLLILSMTDFFNERPFKRTSIASWLLIFSATVTTLPVIRNYFKNKKTIDQNTIDE